MCGLGTCSGLLGRGGAIVSSHYGVSRKIRSADGFLDMFSMEPPSGAMYTGVFPSIKSFYGA